MRGRAGTREVGAAAVLASRRLLLGCAAALLVLIVLTLAVWPGVRDAPGLDDTVNGLPPQLRESLGLQALTTPVGYLRSQLYALTLPAVLLAVGVALGLRAVAGEEETGRLGRLLSGPVTRQQVLLVRTGALTGALLALALSTAVVTAVGVGLVGLDVGAGRLLAATWACAALGCWHLALAVALGGLTGSRGLTLAVSAAVAVGGWLADTLLPLVPPVAGAQQASPWHWALSADPVAHGVDAGGSALLLTTAAALVAVGLVGFTRRDLRS